MAGGALAASIALEMSMAMAASEAMAVFVSDGGAEQKRATAMRP